VKLNTLFTICTMTRDDIYNIDNMNIKSIMYQKEERILTFV